MNFQAPNSNRMKIHSLIFRPAGVFNPLSFRPYQIQLNNNTLGAVLEATAGGTQVSAETLAPVAGEIMRPSFQPQGVIQIPNGWGTERLLFVMQIEYPSLSGNRVMQHLSGFTNKSDLSFRDTLDPNMLLYINNSTLYQELVEHTPLGPRSTWRPTTAAQVLSKEALGVPAMMSGNAAPIRTQRPEDLFSVAANTMMAGVSDMRPTFLATEPLKKSTRSNNISSDYLARALTRTAAAIENADIEATSSEISRAAAGLLGEPILAHDNFIKWLRDTKLLTNGGAVAWGDLCHFAPEADFVAKVYRSRGPTITSIPTASDSQHWQGSDYETSMATMISQMLPGLLMELMIGELSFRATNRFTGQLAQMPGAQHQFFVTGGRTVAGQTLTEVGNSLTNRMLFQILPEISSAGQLEYYIEGTFNIYGDSSVSVSIGGKPMVNFSIPSFCDSLFTPVVTSAPESLLSLGSDLEMLAKTVANTAIQQRSPFQMNPIPGNGAY